MKILTTRKRKRIIILITVVAVLFAACAIYVSDYYHADMSAIEDMEFASELSVESETWEDGTLVFTPEEAETGLIFYPGGKVEYLAYQPLMQACAAEGILCVLVEMKSKSGTLEGILWAALWQPVMWQIIQTNMKAWFCWHPIQRQSWLTPD